MNETVNSIQYKKLVTSPVIPSPKKKKQTCLLSTTPNVTIRHATWRRNI